MATNVKEVKRYQVSINWYGTWKTSPEYSSIKETMAAAEKYAERFNGKYLNITLITLKRYVAAE